MWRPKKLAVSGMTWLLAQPRMIMKKRNINPRCGRPCNTWPPAGKIAARRTCFGLRRASVIFSLVPCQNIQPQSQECVQNILRYLGVNFYFTEFSLAKNAIARTVRLGHKPHDAEAVFCDEQFLGAIAEEGADVGSDDFRREHLFRVIGSDNRVFGKTFRVFQGLRQMIEIGESGQAGRPHHHVETGLEWKPILHSYKQPQGREAAGGQCVNDRMDLDGQVLISTLEPGILVWSLRFKLWVFDECQNAGVEFLLICGPALPIEVLDMDQTRAEANGDENAEQTPNHA